MAPRRVAAVVTALVTFGIAGLHAQAPAESQLSRLKKLSLEELMEIDVTSASRRAERVRDTAAAISVVGTEELRRSGTTTLAEALRLADGVAVSRFNNGTWAVSTRGFATNAANKLLVLVDGRSVYTQLFSGVFWETVDAVLADVDRLEVIRGPAGTLWGANAVNGVINITSKPAEQTQGWLVSFGAGNEERGTLVARYGGRAGATGHYRTYVKTSYFDSPVFAAGADAHQDRRHAQGGFRGDWRRGSDWLTLQGDAYYGRMGLVDRPDLDVSGGNVLARWVRGADRGSRLELRGYVDVSHRRVPRQIHEDRRTLDVEMQHEIGPTRRHNIVWGTGYRLTSDQTEGSAVIFFEPPDKTLNLFNAFVQDEFTVLPDRLYATLGTKLERTSYTGWEIQPNVRVRVPMGSRQMAWGAVSRAVRTPTRFDQDIRVPVSGRVVIAGSREFDSEELTAFEAGYRVQPTTQTSFDVAVFRNVYDRLRSQEPSATVLPLILDNKLNARSHGIEIAASYQPLTAWLLHASYAHLDLTFTRDPGSRDTTNAAFEAVDPDHLFAFRSYVDLPGNVEVDAFLRAVSTLPHHEVPGYTELTLRAGWQPSDRLDLSLTGRDLLHQRHAEFGAAGAARVEFQRAIFGRVAWRF